MLKGKWTWTVAVTLLATASTSCETGVRLTNPNATESDQKTDVDSETDRDTDTDTDMNTDDDSGSDTVFPDGDSDGWVDEFDCEDNNPDINPGKEEIFDPPNQVDEDCDGLTDENPPDPFAGGIPESCELASRVPSSIGCRFFAVDLDQMTHDATQFAVAVANVQLESDATVTVEEKNNGNWELAAPEVTISSLDLSIFELPNRVQEKTGIMTGGAFRVTSDVPIAVYQFNPLGYSTSTDASMLYPVTTWDTANEVVKKAAGHHQYFTIASGFDGTIVNVVATEIVHAGPGMPDTIQPGVPFSISLDEGDVAQFRPWRSGEDYTGTTLRSNIGHPIAVFSGHPCAYVGGSGAADHLEEQISGLRRWGKSYVAASLPVRNPPPNPPETMAWLIYASVDDTEVTITAPDEVKTLPTSTVTLQKGEKIEFHSHGTVEVPGDFHIEATQPIAVLGFMTGGARIVGGPIGDPFMVQYPPSEQFLPRYVVLVPEVAEWTEDFAVITRPSRKEILLDGIPIPNAAFHDVGNGWEVGRISLEDGVHDIQGDEAFGVLILGIGRWDSYGYAGGTGTKKINPHVP